MSVEYIKKRGGHHSFRRSEYFGDDRDEDFNICELNEFYHQCIHAPTNDREVKIGKEQDEKCKRLTLIRYGNGKNRKLLEEIMYNRQYDKRKVKK